MSVLANLEAFAAAVAGARAAFDDQLEDDAKTIQLLLRDGRSLQRAIDETVERCAELEGQLAKVTAERDEARGLAVGATPTGAD